jgi:hypothetical protein
MYLEQKERPPVVLQLDAKPVLRAETRTERARLVVSWVWEEALGFVTTARRLIRRTAPAN